MTTTENFKMLPEEIEIKRLENVSVTMTAFLTYKKIFAQNVFITNKRILIINSMTPYLTLPLSIFYNKADFDNSSKITSSLILSAEQKDDKTILSGKGIWGLFKPKWTIKDTDIVGIVSKNKTA